MSTKTGFILMSTDGRYLERLGSTDHVKYFVSEDINKAMLVTKLRSTFLLIKYPELHIIEAVQKTTIWITK